MKKLALFLTAALMLPVLWGYSSAITEVPPFDPDPVKPASAYDANAMVDARFKVVDEKNMPVSNLCVNLEYKSGRKGSYMPGDALTYSNGVVTRSAHPNATYTVYVTDRKMLDYKGETVRNQMKFTVTIKENAKNNFKLVWKKPSPNELDIASKQKVTLEFLDKNGKPIQDLWISMNPANDKNPEPRQIVLGITDKDGRVYWTLPEKGKFNMVAWYFDNKEQGKDKSQTYTFSVSSANSKHSFTWNHK